MVWLIQPKFSSLSILLQQAAHQLLGMIQLPPNKGCQHQGTSWAMMLMYVFPIKLVAHLSISTRSLPHNFWTLFCVGYYFFAAWWRDTHSEYNSTVTANCWDCGYQCWWHLDLDTNRCIIHRPRFLHLWNYWSRGTSCKFCFLVSCPVLIVK